MSETTQASYPVQKYFPAQCQECPTLIGMIEDGEFGEFPVRSVAKEFAEYCISQSVGERYLDGCESGPLFGADKNINEITCGMTGRTDNEA